MNEDLKKKILYHYRRGNFSKGYRDFRAILERNDELVKVGEHMDLGTKHTPRGVFDLVEQGYEVKGILSCYEWRWWAYRYINYWHPLWKMAERDWHGRYRIKVEYEGYYDLATVIESRHPELYPWRKAMKNYHHKYYTCTTLEEHGDISGGIPDEVEDMFYTVE